MRDGEIVTPHKGALVPCRGFFFMSAGLFRSDEDHSVMTQPLRTTISITAIVVVVLLGGILVLGLRQYQLYTHHEQIIGQSEKLLFQFATVREHITVSLLERRYQQLAGIVREVEALQGSINQMVESAHIPDEYKFSFVSQVDLPSIILLLYQGASGEVNEEKVQQLNRETRLLGERLMLFDRVLVNYAKRKILGFQSLVIGLLALAVFVVVNLLVLGHRRLAAPLMGLARQVREVGQGRRRNIEPAGAGEAAEVIEVAAAFQELLENRLQNQDTFARYNQILYAVHRAGLMARQAQNRETLFQDVCRNLLLNEDYCLVWVGVPDETGEELLPLVADGVTVRNDRRGESCLALLLAEAKSGEGDADPAQRAFRQGKPVVDLDILGNIPKGHLKNTPLAEGQANCAALPLVCNHTSHGVLVIYSSETESFSDEEMKLLGGLAGDVAFALYNLELRQAMARQQCLQQALFDIVAGPIFLADGKGTIQQVNGAAMRMLALDETTLPGRNLAVLLGGLLSAGAIQQFRSLLDNRQAGILEAPLFTAEGSYRLALLPLPSPYSDGVLVSGLPVVPEVEPGSRESILHFSQLAVLGELTSGISHEINNMSNGIINYAQILSDEAGEQAWPPEQKGVLVKIIGEGERIAEIVQKLLAYDQKNDDTRKHVAPAAIVADALLLLRHLLRNDGIRVDVHFADDLPLVAVCEQHLLQVFLNILNHARISLNQHYPGRDDNKRLEIGGAVVNREGRRWLRTLMVHHGAGIEPGIMAKIFAPSFPGLQGERADLGLWVSRILLTEQQGHLAVESRPGEGTEVSIDLPVD